MLSVSYAGKKAYSAGKTSGVLRGGASGANRCYVLAHCGGGAKKLWPFPTFWDIFAWAAPLKQNLHKFLICFDF